MAVALIIFLICRQTLTHHLSQLSTFQAFIQPPQHSRDDLPSRELDVSLHTLRRLTISAPPPPRPPSPTPSDSSSTSSSTAVSTGGSSDSAVSTLCDDSAESQAPLLSLTSKALVGTPASLISLRRRLKVILLSSSIRTILVERWSTRSGSIARFSRLSRASAHLLSSATSRLGGATRSTTSWY